MPPVSGKIRVEIDDFAELHTVDELKKPVKIGGVEWTFGTFSETSARTAHVRHLGFLIHCNKSTRSNLWKVSASIEFKILRSGATSTSSDLLHVDFNSKNKTFEIPNFMNWSEVTSVENGYVSDNTAVVEAEIHVEDVEGCHVELQKKIFVEEEDQMINDAILVINGSKRIHVARNILSVHSGFFRKMFFENGSMQDAEYPVEEMEESEFLDFLNLIYRTSVDIDAKNVDPLLKLADRFETPWILEKCERFLINSPEFHIVDKLKYAEVYKFSALQNHCLCQLKTTQEVLDLSSHERYGALGPVTSEALFQRISEISREGVKEEETQKVEEDASTC
ncbi:unnamed protein product [Caenorhabditis brenneri]